jgi:hypothetical protein
MAGVEGVITTRDANGKLASVTIDANKHKKAIAALQEMGLLEKTDLREEFESGNFITIEEAREHTHEFIKNLPWQK